MTTNISAAGTQDLDVLEIDLRKILQTVMRSKRTLAIFTVATALLTVLIGWSVGKYESVGYFQFGTSLPEYKKLQSSMATPGRWSDFLSTQNKAELDDMEDMKYSLPDERAMSKLIAPIYAFTKAELKDLPASADKDATAGISALKISFKAKTRDKAQKGVLVLGDFVRDTAILMRYEESARSKYAAYFSTQRKYEDSVIETKYQLEQMQIRKANMQKILHDYPDSVKSDSRQLVSISEGSARYLSPVTQLVAIQTSIDEQMQSLPRIMRDQRMNDIYLHYYEKVLALLAKSKSGETFLKTLPTLRDSLNLDLKDEVEKMVYNNIALEDQSAQSAYFEGIRFIGEPTRPFRRSPGLALLAVLGLLLGGLLGCGYILISNSLKELTITPAALKMAA